MFVGAVPQAAAGTLSYTAATLPSDLFGGITAAGVVINDFAVSVDGQTIYVAGTGPTAFKSTNGGRGWLPLVTGLAANSRVAMAPDNPNFVVYMDATVAATVATVSINGGAFFSSLGNPRGLATATNNVSGLDVSKTVGGINYIAVAGATAAGASAVCIFDKGAGVPTWRNACVDAPYAGAGFTVSAVSQAVAVKFSPNFDIDGILFVVNSDVTNLAAEFHVLSIAAGTWNNLISGYGTYLPAGTAMVAIAAGLTRADIAFDPNYSIDESSLRTAYISFNEGLGQVGSIYRCVDNVAPAAMGPAGNPGIWSIALNAAGTVMVAGASESNIVYTNTLPASVFGAFVPNRAVKRIGCTPAAGDDVKVGWSGANVVASKRGVSGAFSLSTDNGLTFNDIALVNTPLTNITDTVVAADGVKRYVVSNGAAASSVFYWDGTVWERTYCVAGANAYVAKASPTNSDVLYLGDKATRTILYTSTCGKTNWLPRTGPGGVGYFIQDIEVENDTTIYVATSTGAAGVVSKSTFYGLTWGLALNPTGADISSITLVAPDKVIACGKAGEVAYTTDGCVSWIPGGAGLPAGGSVYAVAADLTTGSNIYAISTAAADVSVYSWAVGAITAPFAPIGAGTATYLSTGIALVDGTLYRVGTTGADSEISRSIDPFFGPFSTWASTGIAAQFFPAIGATNVNVAPDVIKVSAGNTLWFTDVVGVNRILTYTDSLAVASAAPALQRPVDGALVQVNNLTGIAYNITLQWASSSFATQYLVDIAQDSAFTQWAVAAGVYNVPLASFGAPIQLTTTGPTGFLAIAYQPGQTYYWRVRASAPFLTQNSQTFSFRIQPGQAMVPALSSPENGGSVTTVFPAFSWTPIGGATSYSFQLSLTPDFAATVYTANTTSAGAGVPAGTPLSRGLQYYWRVKALTPAEGEWSTVGNFMVAALPVVTSPTPQVTVTTKPADTIIVTVPAATTTSVVVTQAAEKVINPTYIWAIIIIGAILVIAVIVLIVRTRRSV
jgi:hypothetical protein